MRPGVEDVVFCFLRFPSGLAAHMHLSWLDPHKERRFTVVGSKRMATFDDMEARAQGHASTTRASTRTPRRYGEYIAALGRHPQPPHPERGAAADRVPPLPRAHRRRRRAALRRPQRPARGAGARGAAALARGELACCNRLSGRPACCSATASSCRTTCELGGARGDPRRDRRRRRRPDPGRRGDRQAAGARPALHGVARGAAARRDRPGAKVCAGAVVLAGARIGARDRRGRPGARARAHRDRARDASSAAGRRSTTTSSSAPASGSRRAATSPPSRWSRTTCSSRPE